MPEFNPQKFKEAILEQKLFSVSLFQKDGVNKLQGKEDIPSCGGRVWRNVKHSVVSKVNRRNASADIREILVGDRAGKITNKNILKYLENNIQKITFESDLKNLRLALVALRGFGADSSKCKEVEKIINQKLLGIDQRAYVMQPEALKITEPEALVQPLQLSTSMESIAIPPERRSKRTQGEVEEIRSMKAPHRFIKSTSDFRGGVLMGVLSSHGNKNNAEKYIKDVFPAFFMFELKKASGNVNAAFEQTCAKVQAELTKQNKTGSSAVISYFDKATNRVYTMTFGENEAGSVKAIVCRKVGDEWKLIPIEGFEKDMTASDTPLPKATIPKPRAFELQDGDRLLLISVPAEDIHNDELLAILQKDESPSAIAQNLAERARQDANEFPAIVIKAETPN